MFKVPGTEDQIRELFQAQQKQQYPTLAANESSGFVHLQ